MFVLHLLTPGQTLRYLRCSDGLAIPCLFSACVQQISSVDGVYYFRYMSRLEDKVADKSLHSSLKISPIKVRRLFSADLTRFYSSTRVTIRLTRNAVYIGSFVVFFILLYFCYGCCFIVDTC